MVMQTDRTRKSKSSRCEDWGPDEIRERGIRLIKFMERRWDICFSDDQAREEILFIGSVDGEDPDGRSFRMSFPGKTPKHIKLDERNHVEKPLLDQLEGLGWEVIDLTDKKQTPSATHPGELHRGRDAAGTARATQGHQPLA